MINLTMDDLRLAKSNLQGIASRIKVVQTSIQVDINSLDALRRELITMSNEINTLLEEAKP